MSCTYRSLIFFFTAKMAFFFNMFTGNRSMQYGMHFLFSLFVIVKYKCFQTKLILNLFQSGNQIMLICFCRTFFSSWPYSIFLQCYSLNILEKQQHFVFRFVYMPIETFFNFVVHHIWPNPTHPSAPARNSPPTFLIWFFLHAIVLRPFHFDTTILVARIMPL